MTRSEMNAQIRNKIMPQKEALERTRQIINQAAGMKIEKGAARPGLDKQAAHAQESRARYLGAIARTLQSARSVAPEWYDGASMLLVLTESGLPRDEACARYRDCQRRSHRHRLPPPILPSAPCRPACTSG